MRSSVLRRHGSIGIVSIVAAGAAAASLLTALPAAAVTVPAWEAGRIPIASLTCTVSNYSPYSREVTFIDRSTPVVTGVSVNGSTSTVVIPSGTSTLTFRLSSSAPCSGAKDFAALSIVADRETGELVLPIGMSATTTNSFAQRYSGTYASTPEFTAGAWTVPWATVSRRYDSFVLDGAGTLLSSSGNLSDQWVNAGAWSTRTIYVLRRTSISTSASRSAVAAGGTVTLRATLLKAGDTVAVPAAGSKLLFQTKVGTGSWTTRATRTAGAEGKVSYSFVPSRTMSWRWVHVAEKSSLYTAGVNAAAKTITVS